MSMIRKIIPVSLYDIPGLEGWLEKSKNLVAEPKQHA
jgi:hypothetical protein